MTVATKSCPMCGSDAPGDAEQCQCGYAFKAAAVDWDPADATPTVPGDGWTMAGWVLTVIGGLGLAITLFMDIAVDGGYGGDDVVNLGLMFQKGFIAACSLAGLGLGILCLGVGAIVKAIGRLERSK